MRRLTIALPFLAFMLSCQHDVGSSGFGDWEEYADPDPVELPQIVGGSSLGSELAWLARLHRLDRGRTYEGGVYGKQHATVHWLTPIDTPQGRRPVYWMIVRLLSKKFGCFMRDRVRTPVGYRFYCRDGRRVSFEVKQEHPWVHLTAVQFDRQGLLIRSVQR